MIGVGPGGGSAMFTAKAVVSLRVTTEVVQEWGECVWTARELADREFQRRLDRSALGALFGLRR